VDIRAGDTVYLQVYWTADSGDSHLSAVIDPAGGLNGIGGQDSRHLGNDQVTDT